MAAIDEFWKEVEPLLVNPEVKTFYRLYYDKTTGLPLFYSMEDLPGDYIEISKEIFAAAETKVKIVNQQIVKDNNRLSVKLVPSLGFGTACHSSDITIVLDTDVDVTYWIQKNYDTN